MFIVKGSKSGRRSFRSRLSSFVFNSPYIHRTSDIYLLTLIIPYILPCFDNNNIAMSLQYCNDIVII